MPWNVILIWFFSSYTSAIEVRYVISVSEKLIFSNLNFLPCFLLLIYQFYAFSLRFVPLDQLTWFLCELLWCEIKFKSVRCIPKWCFRWWLCFQLSSNFDQKVCSLSSVFFLCFCMIRFLDVFRVNLLLPVHCFSRYMCSWSWIAWSCMGEEKEDRGEVNKQRGWAEAAMMSRIENLHLNASACVLW